MVEKDSLIAPSYFAIIPARVRYSPEICANAKLLYGEITALCNEKGYCWAGNDYFAKLYNKHKDTISDWVSQLVSGGFLTSEIIYKNGTKEIEKRILRLTESIPLSAKTPTPPRGKSREGIGENTEENNTMNSVLFTEVNNTVETKKRTVFKPPSVEDVAAYCKERNNNVDPENFCDFYQSKNWYVGKNKMKDWKAAVRTWEKTENKSAAPKNQNINRHQKAEEYKNSGKYGGY